VTGRRKIFVASITGPVPGLISSVRLEITGSGVDQGETPRILIIRGTALSYTSKWKRVIFRHA
jgi:hypothetical protein